MARGRKRAYTADELERAVDKYFKTITREVEVTELVPTGELDKYGHEIKKPVVMLNCYGKPVKVTEYIVPPSPHELYEFLHIDKSTWCRYKEQEAYQAITEYTFERMKAYRERLLLTREGKNLRGVEFDLANNYYRDRKSKNADQDTRAQLQAGIQALADILAEPLPDRSIEELSDNE